MTPNEHQALQERLTAANRCAQRLETTIKVLKILQGGSEACAQHEEVAERLQPPSAERGVIPDVRGFQVLLNYNRYSLELDMVMPDNVKAALREAVRALVRHLKAEYEAS